MRFSKHDIAYDIAYDIHTIFHIRAEYTTLLLQNLNLKLSKINHLKTYNQIIILENSQYQLALSNKMTIEPNPCLDIYAYVSNWWDFSIMLTYYNNGQRIKSTTS